jgi:hypothetical protein
MSAAEFNPEELAAIGARLEVITEEVGMHASILPTWAEGLPVTSMPGQMLVRLLREKEADTTGSEEYDIRLTAFEEFHVGHHEIAAQQGLSVMAAAGLRHRSLLSLYMGEPLPRRHVMVEYIGDITRAYLDYYYKDLTF